MQNNKVADIRLQLMNLHASQHGKYTFIRIPKTGSLSMNTALFNTSQYAIIHRKITGTNKWLQAPDGGEWWDHYTAQFCLETLGPVAWKDSINFTVVRNPWARLYSLWKYNTEVSSALPFEKFIMSGCPYPRQPHHEFTEPDNLYSQRDWVVDANDNIIVNFICRLEEIEIVGVPFFKAAVDENFKMPDVKKNKTSEPDEYKSKYSSEMIDKVSILCKDCIELFHYTFDGFKEPGWFYWSE